MYEQWANKNYYEMFGLTKDASKKEIKEAYKNVALVYHPDSNFFDEIIDNKLNDDQSKIFQLLTAAYSTLMDDEKRKKYDETILIKVEGWDLDDDEDENEEEKSETKIFSFDELEMKYKGSNFGVFGTIQKIESAEPIQILTTYEIMNKQASVLNKVMRFIGLYY